MQTILVIEDEKSIADTIIHSLEREGHSAVWSERGRDGLERLRQGDCALVVLDVGLPDVSGFELCKTIRAFSDVPIIFLTARDDEIDRIVGLEIGADDYVTKPFSPRELATRIKAVLRRGARQAVPGFAERQPGQAGTGPANGPGGANGAQRESRLHIDGERMRAAWGGTRLELTRYEFKLLALLAARPGRVFTREAIMDAVWGQGSPSLDRTVDAHVKSLRSKFRELDPCGDPIVTHRGLGYSLREGL